MRMRLLGPGGLLRAEGLGWLLAGCLVYGHLSLHLPMGRWLFFAVCFLAPDLSLLCFLSARKGFAGGVYNLAHWSVLPLVLAGLSWRSGWDAGEAFGLVWVCHIGFDRVLGFGLKYPGSFKVTHLQRCDWGGEV